MLITALRRDHTIGGAVGLPRIDLLAGRLFVMVIEHLAFTHAFVRGVPVTRITNCQAVVAARRQFDLEPRDEISIFLFGVDRAAFARAASNSAFFYLVIVQRPGPALEILAIEDGFKTLRVGVAQKFVCFFRTDLAKEKVAPADLAAMGLELKRSFGWHG